MSNTPVNHLKPEYGNWVSKRMVYVPLVIGMALVLLMLWSLLFAIPAAALLLVAVYFAYARYLFGPRGGDVQGAIWAFLLDHVNWEGQGKALDIGCGSGALCIGLAKKFPLVTVVGIDNWGKQWEYSKALCEQNAAIEGVGERTSFREASASALPFADEAFDLVVSNLTFHEVRDTPDKLQLLREGLRVLKKDGLFAFQDLFLMRQVYGDVETLLQSIRDQGTTKVDFLETNKEPFIPWALRLPFMVGTIGLIVGVK